MLVHRACVVIRLRITSVPPLLDVTYYPPIVVEEKKSVSSKRHARRLLTIRRLFLVSPFKPGLINSTSLRFPRQLYQRYIISRHHLKSPKLPASPARHSTPPEPHTMAAATELSHHFPRTDDVETASVHSEAPSYVSEAPSYHTVASQHEPIPPYTPPGTTTTSHSTSIVQPGASTATSGQTSAPARTPPSSSRPRTTGLPPIPPRSSAVPQLDQFRIPTWSPIHSNPTYHNVARRRARGDANDPVASLRRSIFLERVAEDEDRLSSSSSSSCSSSSSPSSSSSHARPGSSSTSSASTPRRPLEDPHLVGEAAAAEARRVRLARERGNEILIQEDRQWNWFIAQMGDWDERDRSWTRFRREIESGQRTKLSRRLAGN
ncbi:hypothetical protein SODALDRAFT_380031 [Sodiomyces alkalinus F11]|uniref:Uncharacterized protein n=1 Tax=Sodiomyces alkalinus (strain CBS 110278 / VKM F-3762 / F11) TaxID=1314773 RepID=A0A3N2PSU3_SODAK|nr:hypothetical protein SODALDRAFT_380031 [Sodiomyces alkalinus F11]ROT37581.1 hypothetical protein SODALDRAFT_380031 [Sodiomyces alkalinus F11]